MQTTLPTYAGNLLPLHHHSLHHYPHAPHKTNKETHAVSKFTSNMDCFLNNAFTVLVIGLILFLTALNQAWGSLSGGLAFNDLNVSHGIMLYGIYKILQALCRILA